VTNSRRLVFILTFTLVVSSSLEAFQGDEWIKFSSEEGGFAVLLPSQPKPVEVKPSDDFTFHMFTVTIARDVYIVGYGDYAPSVRLNHEGELKANRDNFLRGLNAALIGSKSIELDGRSGLEFTGESAEYYFQSRVYLFGNRVHQIAVAFPKEEVDSTKIDRFFSSFALTTLKDDPKP